MLAFYRLSIYKITSKAQSQTHKTFFFFCWSRSPTSQKWHLASRWDWKPNQIWILWTAPQILAKTLVVSLHEPLRGLKAPSTFQKGDFVDFSSFVLSGKIDLVVARLDTWFRRRCDSLRHFWQTNSIRSGCDSGLDYRWRNTLQPPSSESRQFQSCKWVMLAEHNPSKVGLDPHIGFIGVKQGLLCYRGCPERKLPD